MTSESISPVRLVWGAVATLLSIIYTALLAPFAIAAVSARRHRIVARVVRLWSWLIVRTCAIKVRFEGLENLAGFKSCVLVANHQSFFDVFAMLAYFPVEVLFVAKKELLKIPGVGYTLAHSEHIVIDRDSGGRSIRRAVEALRDGWIVTIFPEGERFNDGIVHTFDDGAAWLAILARRPVVPMAIVGSGRVFPRRALMVTPGGEIRFRIGTPIPTEGLHSADRAELTRRVEDEVRAHAVEG